MSKKFEKPTRVWVNAPSTHDPYHIFHGKCGLAFTHDDGETRLYFTHGPMDNISISNIGILETKNSQNNNLNY
jgi:hypothetical protein